MAEGLIHCDIGDHLRTVVYRNLKTGRTACAACIAQRYYRYRSAGQRRRAKRWRERHPQVQHGRSKEWRRHHPETRNRARKKNYDKNRRRKYNGRNRNSDWTTKERQRIMAKNRPKDRVLSAYLGRSVQAIQVERCRERKRRTQRFAVAA